MVNSIRRVVTGHDAQGKAIILSDGDAENVFLPPARPGVRVTNLWVTDGSPAGLSGSADPAAGSISLTPPAQGAVFRIVEFPPEKDWIDSVDRAAAKASFAAFGAEGAADSSEEPPHPLMHKTITIDYALVLSGECYLVLDDSEVLVKTGDTIVQRGTNHAWSNRSDAPCQIAFILIDGQFEPGDPAGAGGH